MQRTDEFNKQQQNEDQEEESELHSPEGQPQPRVLNLQHYVGHSLVKQQQQQQQPQQQQNSPPPNFRPLSRTQQPVSYSTKSHKPGSKLYDLKWSRMLYQVVVFVYKGPVPLPTPTQ